MATHRNLNIFIRNTLSIGAAVGVSGFIALSNGLFLDEVRKWYQLNEKAEKPKSMDPKLVEICVNALQETRIPQKKKLLTKFFYVNGTEIFSAGSYEMKGAIIGIPFNFTFNSLNDINKDLIRTPSGQRIDWDSDAGQQLLQSMILSENAKKFAVAREMYFANNFRVLWLSVVGMFCALFPGLINELYTKGYKSVVPLRNIIFLYAFSISLAVFKFMAFDDICTSYYGSNADKLAAALSDEYRKGAIEFYRKKLMANKAWRVLLGNEGLNLYNDVGDENDWRLSKRVSRKLMLLEGDTKQNSDSLDESATKRIFE